MRRAQEVDQRDARGHGVRRLHPQQARTRHALLRRTPPDGEVVGQDVSEKTLRDVSQAFTNHIEPRVYPTVERLVTDDGKAYIRAQFSGDERPYACDGRYRIRSADEDLPMSAAMLEEMVLERASKSSPWDRRPSGKAVSDV